MLVCERVSGSFEAEVDHGGRCVTETMPVQLVTDIATSIVLAQADLMTAANSRRGDQLTATVS